MIGFYNYTVILTYISLLISAVGIGFAVTGSFCTFSQVFPQMKQLVDAGYRVIPILSQNAYETDTRFGKAAHWIAQAEAITGETVIHTIAQAEPIGPRKLLDLLIIYKTFANVIIGEEKAY